MPGEVAAHTAPQPADIKRIRRERCFDSDFRYVALHNCLPKGYKVIFKDASEVEPVEGDFGILADLNEVAVGITHVAAPFQP